MELNRFINKRKEQVQREEKEQMEERIYWLDNEGGRFQGGFFTRCDLFKNIKMFEEKGYRVIGIKVTDSWNLEFICDVPKKKRKKKK